MEKLLQSMNQMKDGMEAMQAELASYVLNHEEGGVSLQVKGDGTIVNLKFANGTSPSAVEKAINNANLEVKAYITDRMNKITPPELKQAANEAA